MQFTGRRYDTGDIARFEIANGRLAHVEPLPPGDAGRSLPWVAPAFFDLQINGYGGQEFSSPALDVEKIGRIVECLGPMGVGRFCPTVTTQTFATLCHALATIARACDESPEIANRIAGIHLEGPYISAEDGPRGAHPQQHCRPPDWQEFLCLQDAARGRIRLLTMSCEFRGAADFIRKATRAGIVVAIGHTAATSEQIRAAADAGARLSTHLGNGAHPVLPRHPNYIWDQLAEDRLMASLIVDGQHLPPAVVKTIVRAKGAERCVLISDLSGLAGLPPGRYASELCELEILADGRLVIAGQRELLAGASRPLGVGVANVMTYAGVDLKTAVEMATLHPARLLGAKQLSLAPGEPADLTLFNLTPPAGDRQAQLEVVATLVAGQVVFGQLPGA